MDVFQLRNRVIDDYAAFTRSFARIRASDIKAKVDDAYQEGRFWPSPLIQLNPSFEPGGTVDELVADGTLNAECRHIFSKKKNVQDVGERITLHQHQVDGIRAAQRGESYVLTTGTGSGKSLAYFVPIIDKVIRRRAAGDTRKRISAIVIYPMNALCNSQFDELTRFLTYGYGEGAEKVTFARYTGQESKEERQKLIDNPPDILLTNYVMLELAMTRQQPEDQKVREHAEGLDFLVLDELHTYRGRQGADVSLLVRRVRERFNEDLLCVGTSATMASNDVDDPAQTVADTATKIFGSTVSRENVISETLRPVTAAEVDTSAAALRRTIEAGVPSAPSFDELRRHPVAAWIEHTLGLERRPNGSYGRIGEPKTFDAASRMLAEAAGVDPETAEAYLSDFLMTAHGTHWDPGDPSSPRFFAFRLHQFVSAAENVYTTLEVPGTREVTLDGQQFVPGQRERRYFNAGFCRNCGQEYFPVWGHGRRSKGAPTAVEPRRLNEGSDDDEVEAGLVMVDPEGVFDPEDVETVFPDDWIEIGRDGTPRLKSSQRKNQPVSFTVDAAGRSSAEGAPAWYLPTFRFCLNCGISYDGTQRSEFTKLTSLTGEGRSSATTVMTYSALRHLHDAPLDVQAKKILSFTDNRQDASLQAGHFNDFRQVLMLRGALLAAMRDAPDGVLHDEDFTAEIVRHLNLNFADYAANPDRRGQAAKNTEHVLRELIGYRIYSDLQRGWRVNNPNLENLDLLRIDYAGLADCAADEEIWQGRHSLLANASPDVRQAALRQLLDAMRKQLAIKTRFLDPEQLERLKNRAYAELVEPWTFEENEVLEAARFMIPRPQPDRQKGPDAPISTISHRSRVGRALKAPKLWGRENPGWAEGELKQNAFERLVDDMLAGLSMHGLVDREGLKGGYTGWQVVSTVLEWRIPDPQTEEVQTANPFFRDLYQNVARVLGTDSRFLHHLEAREHTAQVDNATRKRRETRFREGAASSVPIEGDAGPETTTGLPLMFCSPTMELGVDIATLNTVYMRNVPPTPANYAQRSGRAGRSGQPALVLTYCAVRSPHDQYFFRNPTRMVAGAVQPPAVELANEDLVASHLNAIWLAETGQKLDASIKDNLSMEHGETLPLRDDIREVIHQPGPQRRAGDRIRRVLEMLAPYLSGENAQWFTSAWTQDILTKAPQRFENTFERWRSLYRAATNQMNAAHAVQMNAAAGERARHEAHRRYQEAKNQRDLLLDTQQSMNADFYTYRYLASEGFLPGYNFPRLPLLAYIPGRRGGRDRDTILSRPRFVGLAEFGPGAIIYHEGRTYKVNRAIMPIHDGGDSGAEPGLNKVSGRVCPACGYGHFGEHLADETCLHCGGRLEGGRELNNLFRIDQVSTRSAERITSDEEERQRQGYEIATTIRFDQGDHGLRVNRLALQADGAPLASLAYAPTATIMRANLGWRRRKAGGVQGFPIEVSTGKWATEKDASEGSGSDGQVERIAPYVEDRKNALLVRPHAELRSEDIATLQYALKQAIQARFQLEDAELAAEALPESSDRRVILLYESAEGGGGVLTRLGADPALIQSVARTALEVCHWHDPSEAFDDPEALEDQLPACEAGCYRCLLTYQNQPDHTVIDRRSPRVKAFLCQLARASGEARAASGGADAWEELFRGAGSSLAKQWLEFLRARGHHPPDKAEAFLTCCNTHADFAYKRARVAVYIDGPHHESETQTARDADITACLEDAGFRVVRFGYDKAQWPEVLAEHSDVFGAPQPREET